MQNENEQKVFKKNKKKRIRLSDLQKKIIFIVVGILLLSGVVYGGWRYLEDAKIKKETAELNEVRAKFNESIKEVEDKALVFISEGKSEKAIEAYDEAIKDTDDPKLIYAFELQKVVVLLNLGHNQLAIDKLLILEKTNQNEDLFQLIAGIYYDLKNYDKAIEYYNKAIKFINKTHIDNTEYYRAKISSIEELMSHE